MANEKKKLEPPQFDYQYVQKIREQYKDHPGFECLDAPMASRRLRKLQTRQNP